MITYKNAPEMIGYTLSILMFLSKSSFLILWVALELNMIIFLILILKLKNEFDDKSIIHASFFYFLIQSLGSMMIMVSGLFNLKEMQISSMLILSLGLILKMGLIPFQMWVYKISYYLKGTSLSMALTLQKIPVILMMMNLSPQTMILMSVWSMLVGSMMIWFSFSWTNMIVSSSIYFVGWLFLISNLNISMMFLIMMLYFVAVKILAEKKYMELKKMSNIILLIGLLMFFIGMPPVSIFMMKMMVVSSSMVSAKSMTTILWLTSALATAGYLKFLWSFTQSTKSFYLEKKKIFLKMVAMGSIVSMFLMFLL